MLLVLPVIRKEGPMQMKWKSWRRLGAAVMLCLSLGSTSFAANHITGAEAIGEVTGDGEHVSHVIVQYDAPVLSSSLSPSDYTVDGRTIEKVYTNTAAEKTTASTESGNYVVLQLQSLPLVDSSVDPHPEDGPVKDRQKKGHGGGPQLGSHGNPSPLPVMKATVSQTGFVKTASGALYGPEEGIETSKSRDLIVEDFIQGTFTDSQQQNAVLKYNLYVPENYDPQKKYPLVLFMHDAGVVSPDVKATLVQGLGAVTFASPEWQSSHPCFVLAPQYDTVIVDDNYDYGPELDRTIHLIQSLCQTYSIDTRRIYNTGQSMGGMTSIAMDVKYPHFFAASYLIACKWNAAVTAPLASQPLWTVICEGDAGAYPSMTEILGNLEKAGTKVDRQTLDADVPAAQLQAGAASLIEPDCNHYLTIYKGGSHRYTWLYAYTMKPALEWIFSQSLPGIH